MSGVLGPLVIHLWEFDIVEDEELSLSISPDSEFIFQVVDDDLIIDFPVPLRPGQQYLLNLSSAGINAEVRFTARFPDLVYIGQVSTNPQVWMYSMAEMNSSQLTHIQGNVLEVTSAENERSIIFLVEDEKGDREIWRAEPLGEDPELLFECGKHYCSELSYSMNGEWIAFSLVDDDANLVILNSSGAVEYRLPYRASEIHFSSDGKLIYFLDNRSQDLVVFNMESNVTSTYACGENLIGSLSEDSKTLLFGSLDFWGGFPVTTINELSVISGEKSELFLVEDDQMEFFTPTYSPGSDMIVLSVRDKQAGISTQLWLMDRKGILAQQVTQDYQYSHTAFKWSPDWQYLAYQRFKIGDSESTPQVAVWDKVANVMLVIAEDAVQPNWVP